ncbi:MAG: 50S ribosomal protein L17 [Candidatus Omnitrophota bacterium]
MRHRKQNRAFDRPKSARRMLIQHLSQSLIQRGRIETTVPKAKETRRLTERLIQYGLRGDLSSYRKAYQLLGNTQTTSLLFKEIVPLFKSRQHGGYTRLLRSRTRPGDGVELAILELVERKAETPKKKEKKEKAKEAPPLTPKPAAPLKKEEASAPPPKRAEAPKTAVKEEKKEKEKKGGFLSNLRKFIRPQDRS